MVTRINTVHSYWMISVATSLFFLAALLLMWTYDTYHYVAATNQLSSQNDVSKALAKYPDKMTHNPIHIPTGIFLQSFFFQDPQTVIISGIIWQKFNKSAIKNKIKKGVILIENNAPLESNIVYEIHYKDYDLVGWSFVGASLYQQFNYTKYPFDEQTVWVSFMPREYTKNVILVPDLKSYYSTRQYDKFGVANNITLRGLYIQETYFDFTDFMSHTNFGFDGVATSKITPQLSYNIVIRRPFFDIFLLYLLPVITVWGLLFGLTMVMSSEKKLADAFNFSAMETLSALAAAFFAILFTQINLRLNFSGHPVTYLEYFYFVTYGLIFFLSINAYLITTKNKEKSILLWKNNLLPKLLFWPAIFCVIDVITFVKFFT